MNDFITLYGFFIMTTTILALALVRIFLKPKGRNYHRVTIIMFLAGTSYVGYLIYHIVNEILNL